MKKTGLVLSTLLGLSMVVAAGSGCRRAAQVAEDQIAEAVVNQAISAYYSASVSVSGQYATLTLTCTKGGELSWSEYVDEEGDGSICYSSESNGCEIEGQNYGDLTLSGSYDICGFPTSYSEEDGRLEDLDGKTLYISGNVTADSANLEARTCDYNLEITKIAISGDGDSLHFTSGVSGDICGRRNFSATVDFDVANDISTDDVTGITPTPAAGPTPTPGA